jgi:putative oxidoreductase
MNIRQRAIDQAPSLLGVLRIVLALLFVEHGSMKLFGFPPSDQFADLKLLSLSGAAGIMEFFGGLLLLVGLFTRQTAFLLSGLMAAAYFIAHASRSFFPALNMGEAAVIYCFLFLYLAAAGGGRWSLDGILEAGTVSIREYGARVQIQRGHLGPRYQGKLGTYP